MKFSESRGPFFNYEEPTNETFGNHPNLRDPLDKKYVYLKNSDTYPSASEGAYATRDVPENTVVVIYGGMLYNNEQTQILTNRTNKFLKEKNNNIDNKEYEALWMYK